jgi:GDP-L-fucose synthase
MNLKSSKIYIAGHNGMVGSSLYRVLNDKGYNNLIGVSSKKLDLTNQSDVIDFFNKEKPDIVINAAGKVGGIKANINNPYQFLLKNLQIQNNLVECSLLNNVEKFIFIGSSSIYPRNCKQPMKEKYLLTGALEPTNEFYSIAKISGIKLCQSVRKEFNKNYFTLLPSNLYGINDSFNKEHSHVIQAMILKFHDAKINNHENVILWGSGSPKREFTFVDDFSESVIFAIENKLEEDFYNVGNGNEISIMDLANTIKNVIGYEGKIIWDKSKPDGISRKLMDSSKFESYGWKSRTNLKVGVYKTYEWIVKNKL